MTIDGIKRLPKLIVFDLDYTLWNTWIDSTDGPPFTYIKEANTLVDRNGYEFGLFPDIARIFALIDTMPETKIAIASRTHTPDWANMAMSLIQIPELKRTLRDCISHAEIYPGSKLNHFKAISEATGIEHQDMIFFDDEYRNRDVGRLGVHVHIIDSRYGVTMDNLQAALLKFDKDSRLRQTKLNFTAKPADSGAVKK